MRQIGPHRGQTPQFLLAFDAVFGQIHPQGKPLLRSMRHEACLSVTL